MIKYSLKCSEDDCIEKEPFDGWFQNSASFEKQVKAGYILKHINFTHHNQEYNFTEKVKSISLSDFKYYFKEAGVKLKHCFGDYQLNKFNIDTSSRLILIFK